MKKATKKETKEAQEEKEAQGQESIWRKWKDATKKHLSKIGLTILATATTIATNKIISLGEKDDNCSKKDTIEVVIQPPTDNIVPPDSTINNKQEDTYDFAKQLEEYNKFLEYAKSIEPEIYESMTSSHENFIESFNNFMQGYEEKIKGNNQDASDKQTDSKDNQQTSLEHTYEIDANGKVYWSLPYNEYSINANVDELQDVISVLSASSKSSAEIISEASILIAKKQIRSDVIDGYKNGNQIENGLAFIKAFKQETDSLGIEIKDGRFEIIEKDSNNDSGVDKKVQINKSTQIIDSLIMKSKQNAQ